MIWSISISAIFVVVLLTLLFHFVPKLERTIIFFASATAATGAVIGVLFGGMQLQAVAVQHKLSTEWQKNEVSFSYAEDWSNQDQVRIEAVILEFHTLSLDEKLNLLNTDEAQNSSENYQKPLTEASAKYEEMALAIKADYADEGILCLFFDDSVTRLWESFEDLVIKNRKFSGRESLFENFEWLANRWKKGCANALIGSSLENSM